MIRKHIQPWTDWARKVVTEPRHELDRWQSAVRFGYDLSVHGWKALNRDNAPQMSAALSFRTLFAMLPVIVVTAVLVNAMQGPQQFNTMIHWVIDAAGLNQMAFKTLPEDFMGPILPSDAAEASAAAATVAMGDWLEDTVGKIAGMNLQALGWIGLVLVIYSAISLMVTIEGAFNSIYGAPEGRSWPKRVLVYWCVLTMGPIFIGVMLYFDRRFTNFISTVDGWVWLLTSIKVFWGFCVLWLLMFVIYMQVPNTRVTARAAIIGAFFAALFLQAGKNLLGAYFSNAVSFSNIYGALGILPVFMFWMYLMWLCVLFGLEVSSTIQMVQGRHLEEIQELQEKRPQNGLVDPASVINVMEIATERFAMGRTATVREIADETLMHEGLVCQLIDRLVRENFLLRVDGGDSAVTLARPPEQISADRLIEIGYCLVDEGGVGRQSALVQRLREAQKRLAEKTTLASLLGGDRRTGIGQAQPQ